MMTNVTKWSNKNMKVHQHLNLKGEGRIPRWAPVITV